MLNTIYYKEPYCIYYYLIIFNMELLKHVEKHVIISSSFFLLLKVDIRVYQKNISKQ